MAVSGYGSSAYALEGMAYLEELAFDLRNSWEHGADEVWRQLDPELWTATHIPEVVLQPSRGRACGALLRSPNSWRD